MSHDVCAPVEGSPFMEGVCMSVSVSAGEFIFRDVLYGWLDSGLLIWAKGRGWWYRREEGRCPSSYPLIWFVCLYCGMFL